jgi:two-component system NarL family sensor kinase
VVWAIWLLILLLELATPPAVVLGILYVVPLLLGASQRTPTQAVELAQAQLRGDVIATLTHDIKTPVLGTLASLPLLENGAVVEAIRNSQQRCLRLIDDLLQVFRAEQEGLQLQLQPCNPLAIAQEALDTMASIATQRPRPRFSVQIAIRLMPRRTRAKG